MINNFREFSLTKRPRLLRQTGLPPVKEKLMLNEMAKLQSTTLAPLLSVRNGARAIDFYKAAFGAVELFKIEDTSGAVVARLSIEGAEFWLADESPEHGNNSPVSLGGSSVRLVLTVDDPDAVFTKAVKSGATMVYEVADQSYGWRVGRITDPFGHHWEIGKPLCDGQA